MFFSFLNSLHAINLFSSYTTSCSPPCSKANDSSSFVKFLCLPETERSTFRQRSSSFFEAEELFTLTVPVSFPEGTREGIVVLAAISRSPGEMGQDFPASSRAWQRSMLFLKGITLSNFKSRSIEPSDTGSPSARLPVMEKEKSPPETGGSGSIVAVFTVTLSPSPQLSQFIFRGGVTAEVTEDSDTDASSCPLSSPSFTASPKKRKFAISLSSVRLSSLPRKSFFSFCAFGVFTILASRLMQRSSLPSSAFISRRPLTGAEGAKEGTESTNSALKLSPAPRGHPWGKASQSAVSLEIGIIPAYFSESLTVPPVIASLLPFAPSKRNPILSPSAS
mmetsp:Transcript_48082/g.94951  ORF Transcript_48082/g.94951 Transcript_48082/m.94951 type:complete len:335 (-) Transcript_48082:228-1232(-)